MRIASCTISVQIITNHYGQEFPWKFRKPFADWDQPSPDIWKTSQWPETQWKIPRISRIRFQCSRETIAENKKFAFGCCDQKSHNISFSQRSRVPVNLRQGSTWHRGNGQKIKRNKQQIKVCNRAHQKGNAYLTRRFCSPTSGHHSQDSTLCGTLGAKTGHSPDTTTLCPTKRDQAKIL